MAKRRMFSVDIVDSDKFTDMPLSSQALYFHLGMKADDDGFVSSPKKVMKSISCSEDDLKVLLIKGFVHFFSTGICVIIDWKMNNYIQKDRYTKTIHFDELSQISSNANGSYIVSNQSILNNVKNLDTECIQDGYGLDTQVRVREVKFSEVKSNTLPEKSGDCELSEKEQRFEKFWELYGRKGNKQSAKKAFVKLSESKLAEVAGKIKAYLDSKPEKQYRLDAEKYLNSEKEHWNDEIVERPKSTSGAITETERAKRERQFGGGKISQLRILDI